MISNYYQRQLDAYL